MRHPRRKASNEALSSVKRLSGLGSGKRLGDVLFSPFCLALTTFALLNCGVALLEPAFMRTQMYDRQYSVVRVRDYARAPKPDIVFMGSSRALNGFDPAQVEAEIARADGVAVHALNLGVAGGSIDVNYLILKNIIRPDKQPSVIVYGLSEFELYALTSDDLAQRINMPLVERLDDFRLYGGHTVEDKFSFVLKRLLPLYRDHELIRSALSIRFNPDDPAHASFVEQPDLPANGFTTQPPEAQASPAALAQNRQEYQDELGHYHVDPAALARLNAFIALAQSRGIAIVLVNMPVAPALRALWPNEETIAQYRALVQSVADEQRMPLLDLYEDEGYDLPASGFFDYQHLNMTGARSLTQLVTQGYLVDRFRPSVGVDAGDALQ